MRLRLLLLAPLLLVLATAPLAQNNANDAIGAYAWANDAAAASYTPDPVYSYNATGGTVTATRSAVGTYAMTFGGVTGDGGHVQVSAYNSNALCTTDGWAGTPLAVRVVCYDAVTRARVDSRYTVLYMDAAGTSAPVAYAWANDAASAAYTPDANYSYDPDGGAVSGRRFGTGDYDMNFAGISAAEANLGTVLVTAYQSSASCWSTTWGFESLGAGVNCWDGSAAVDVQYDVLFVDAQSVAAPGMAYAWANDRAAASYTPEVTFSHNAAGGAITATRAAEGVYNMTFSGLGGQTSGGSVQTTGYGSNLDGGYCTVNGWTSIGSDVNVRVRCYDAAGAPADSRYTTLFTWPTRVPVAAEETPDGTVSLTASPNPARGAARVTLSVPTAQAMTVEVFDVLGRSVATLHDGPVAAGSLALPLDASALPSGVYHVRAVGETVRLSERITVVR